MSESQTSEQYTCAHCGGTFDKAWSEAEVLAEKNRDYPQFTIEECAVICDDCYQRYNAWAKSEGLVT